MPEILSNNEQTLNQICKEFGVKRLRVFGSLLTDKFNDNSDLDFLLAFKDSLSIEEYTDNYFALHYKLEELFSREIDLITENSLSNPYFIESINKRMEVIYED